MLTEMNEDPLVSIIIVNYNGSKFLEPLFNSLLRQRYRRFEVIVVDNHSSDNSKEILRKYHNIFNKKGITFKYIVLRKNTGFCLGNDIGYLYTNSNAKYVVLLNNDTVVEEDWLKELVLFMEKHLNVGAASSLILFDYTNRIDNTGGRLDIYGGCIGRGLMEHRKVAETHDPFYGFFYASGCSMIIRRELFKELKGFDPWLSMYHDDIDLSWQIRLLGYKIGFVKDSVCHHIRRPGFGRKLPVWKFYLANRNRIRILIKNYELGNIVRRIIPATILSILAGLFLSIVSRNAYYLLYSFKIITWNIRNLGNTLIYRRLVQSKRKVSDREIEKYMDKKPLGLWHAKAYLRLT